ncbi:hypothetical protein ACFQL1_24120 [Halomicroarcula sp. GCM10025709]|uniref:hypothetical protein n=1 Tax=Haloarcula TaxID=2237 RepID=UPI0024C2DD64|nr:hypothetical protein [Halomicroarcula sp. YJ-61-S]
MVTANSLAKFGRYSSGALVLIFLLNLLLDSEAIPFVDWSPFLGGVEQFLILLVASALISIEFIIADMRSEAREAEDLEQDGSTEPPVDVGVES